MKCYELNTITYGTASAPFLAVRCLYQLAEDNKITYPKASNIIKNDFYVDDLLTGANSQSELVQLQHEISTILNSAKLELRKWLSNKPELMKQFHFNQDLDVNIIQLGENEQNKTLDIFWNANLDTIQYSISQCKTQGNVTKRNILSIVSQIFDPLGLLGPVIVVAKILIKICQKQAFGEDYNNLINNKSLNKRSKLLCLNPFVDNKILQVGGRIRNSNFDYDKKFPVILPHKHNLTKLIMTHEHNRLLHCGPSMLLSSTRERYWPLSGRNLARGIVRRCVTCFTSKPNSIQYLMGDLPASRVNQYIPFFNTAVELGHSF